MSLLGTIRRAEKSWARDAHLPLRIRLSKGREYLSSLLLARLRLRHVDEVGSGVRTIGRPRIENFGTMRIGDGTILRSVMVPVELTTAYGATLVIGRRCSFNYGVSIGARARIEIGNRVRMGPFAMIIDSQFHDVYDRDREAEPEPVVVGDDVWIGTRASVLPGVTIGRGSIVGAHSLVNRDIAPFTIVGGVPAKPLGQIDPSRFVVREED